MLAAPATPGEEPRSRTRLLNWIVGVGALVIIARGYLKDTQPLSGTRLTRRRCAAYSPAALARGTRVEQKEHRLPTALARRIARDHLCDDTRYYSR